MDAYSIFPEDVWYKVSECLDPKSLVNLGGVSRVLKEVASDKRLWSKHWKSDYYGSLRTNEDGKDYRLLYRQWREGRPSTEDFTTLVHYLSQYVVKDVFRETGITSIKLSQAGPGALVAWSMGEDGTLVRNDVTTCKISRWFTPKYYGPLCLDVLNVDGWVLTGGKEFIVWDHRQRVFPIFKQDYLQATKTSSYVKALVSEESSGQPRVLTAGDRGDVCLWDLRKPDEILTKYARQGVYDEIHCLAVKLRHGTLIAGGPRGLVFWDFATGTPWATPDIKSQTALLSQDARSIVVGTERMVVGGRHGVFEWAIPGPLSLPCQLQGVVDLMPPRPGITGAYMGRTMHALFYGPYYAGRYVLPHAMQGLGEGPAGILAGRADGSIGMWKCQNNDRLAQRQHAYLAHSRRWPGPAGVRNQGPVPPEELPPPFIWSLQPVKNPVSCLAATDEVVVNGFRNGMIRIARMKQF